MAIHSLILKFLLLLSVTATSTMAVKLPFRFHATVAKDGSGDYTKVADAIAAAPNHLPKHKRFYIRIKPGVYKEHVLVPARKTYLALIGDDAATTKITYNLNNKSSSLHESGTLIVYGTGFMAWTITIENYSGPDGGQAVALDNAANHTAFYKCVILGHQDTLLADTGLQFYKNCHIYGAVDFICGGAKAVFQDCRLFGSRIGDVTVTAQAKETAKQSSGFSFQSCMVTVAPELEKDRSEVKVYLGRPWNNYATVVFMESYLDDVVQRYGWKDWDSRTELVFLAEYGNRGPGARTDGRVKWHGVHVFTKAYQAVPFTVSYYIDGYSWIPETGIPVRPGLNYNYVASS